MSSLPADLIIWTLLFISIVFGGLALMGLFLFPDTRSRMFTAFRAVAISLGAVAFAVVIYGYILFMTTGSDQYPALILRTLFLVFVLTAGTWVMYGIIRAWTRRESPEASCRTPPEPKTE